MVAESVVVVRTLVQKAPERHVRIMRQLARLLDRIRVPTARASVVWMVGAYHELMPKVGPDTLRVLAAGFRSEVSQVRRGLLSLFPSLAHSLARSLARLLAHSLSISISNSKLDLSPSRSSFPRSLCPSIPFSHSPLHHPRPCPIVV
jgi:AP-3 complex subunit beta